MWIGHRCDHFILLNLYNIFIFVQLSLVLSNKKKIKLNDKTQPTILIIDPHNHIHLYINNTLSIYLTNQMLEQSLTLFIF